MGIGRIALPGGASGVAVVAGRTYTGMATLKAATTARTARVTLRWYNAANALISSDVGAYATLENDADGSLHRVVASAPAGAVRSSLAVEINTPVVGETFYMDQAGILTGDAASWLPGGFGAGGFVIERSTDGQLTWAEIVGASRTSPLTLPNPADPFATVYDLTAPLGQNVSYRALAVASGVYSAYSAIATSYINSLSWWLKDELDSTRNMPVAVVEWKPTKPVKAGVFYPRGRSNAVVASGAIFGAEGSLVIRVLNQADYLKLHALLESKRTLLLQSVLPQQWRLRVIGDISDELIKAGKLTAETTPIRFAYEVSTQMVQVAAA
jgi:hypothetical protein